MLTREELRYITKRFPAEERFDGFLDPQDPPERAAMLCAVACCEHLNLRDPVIFFEVLEYMKGRLLK